MTNANQKIRIGFDGRLLSEPMFGLPRYLLHLLQGVAQSQEIASTVFNYPDQKPKYQDLYTREPIGTPLGNNPILWEHLYLPHHFEKIDIYHAPNNIGLPFASSRKTKKVLTVYDLIPFHFPAVLSWKAFAYWKFSLKLSIHQADRIITGSKTIQDEIVRIFPEAAKKICVLYDCVILPQTLSNSDAVCTKYDLYHKKFLIYHGGYRSYKNVEFLLYCFEKIIHTNQDARLVLTGNCPENISLIIKKLSLEKYIVLPGVIADEDLFALLKSAHFAVSTSISEGFNFPPLEALFVDTHSLVSDIPINREILGNAVTFFNPLDQDDFIKNALNLLSMPKTHPLESTIAERQIQEYLFDAFSKRYIKFYQDVFFQAMR